LTEFEHIKRGGISILKVNGSLDATNAGALKSEVIAIEEAGVRQVVVDLSGLRIIDSSGVGVLLSLNRRVREAGGRVCFAGITEQPLEVFKVLRLDRAFEMCATVEEGLAKLRVP
jgi:anti-sigma B factor antagonist